MSIYAQPSPDAPNWEACLSTLRTNAFTLYLIDEAQHTTLLLRQQEQGWRMEVYGAYPLWSQIARACQQWHQAGRPGRSAYRLRIDVEGRLALLAP